MREVSMPSGAVVKINAAPFVDSKNLYQALLRELKDVKIDTKMEVAELYKELFCRGFSSPEIEQCLWKCLERCTYNSKGADLRINKDTFESIQAREDFMAVCIEVVKDNVGPFIKSLWQEFSRMSAMINDIQKSK